MQPPPARIELTSVGAALRRHESGDLDAVHRAIEESRDHLRPWMPWADQSRGQGANFLREAIAKWDAAEEFSYLITDAADGAVLGGAGLHRRLGPGALEIGYWLRAGATGRGVMTAAAGALTDAALVLDGVDRVEIHCDEANLRSAAVARRLGYRLARIDDKAVAAPGEHGRSMIWVRTSPVGSVEV